MSIKEITIENREKVVSFFKENWGSTEMCKR